MPWQDQLREGQFRGAAFKTKSHSAGFGRRRARHVYARRDIPFFEDLGRQSRSFQITAFVLGDDYMAARDALITACEKAGPGTLIHPYLGEMTVICSNCRLRETDTEGRMATVDLAFEQAGEERFPEARPDTRGLVRESSDFSIGAIEADFADRFAVKGRPEFVTSAAVDLAKQAIDDIEAGTGQLVADPEKWATLSRDIVDLRGNLGSLAQQPDAFASALTGPVRALGELPATGGQSLPALRRLASFGDGLPAVPAAPVSRAQQSANQDAMVSLVRRTAVTEAARTSASTEFDSYDAALAVRNELVELLDREISIAGDTGQDGAFDALSGLSAEVNRDLNTRALELPRLNTLVLHRTEPALVTAYRLYGDAGRDQEIVARNGVFHPGFVPGGDQIRVLE